MTDFYLALHGDEKPNSADLYGSENGTESRVRAIDIADRLHEDFPDEEIRIARFENGTIGAYTLIYAGNGGIFEPSK